MPVRSLGKITPPTLQRVFGNERLFARLDAARFYPVVWVHGPPGAGKTTLVASYLADRGIQPVWCRLDEGDSDPASVFLCLAEAAKQCAPGLAMPLLQPEFRTAMPLFTRRFFRDLFAPEGVQTIVLDDYHEVAVGAELHACLPAGLEEVPGDCRVIVISRTPPPSQLARLRLNGKVDVIEPDALRLNTKEIRAVAQKRGVEALDVAEERIAAATQGWAAGVILMLEAATSAPVEARGDTAPLPEILFDYFAGEVFQRMDGWAPTALSTLALMPTMTAVTAERLVGRPEAGALLENLRRRNYFTTRDSGIEPRYRFHPLFRDFLLAKLHSPATHQDYTLLKVRAAALLDEDGQADAAVQLLAETGQVDALAALVKRRAGALLGEGRNDTLVAWFAKLDAHRIASDAWLSYWRGMARVNFDPIDAYPHFTTALALFEAADDITGQFAAWAGAAEAVRLDAVGDVSRFDPLVVKMHGLLERHPTFPSSALEITVSASMATALSRRSASRDECEHWAVRARTTARAINNAAVSIRLSFASAIIDVLDGHYKTVAEALAALPDPLTLDHLPLAQWAGLMATTLAAVHGHGTDDPEAFVEDALKKLEQTGLVLWMPMQAACLAIFAFGRNDAATCDRWRAKTASLSENARVALGPIYYVVAASHKILVGDFDGARVDADKGISAAVKRGYRYFTVQTRVVRANALLAADRLDEAADELDRLDEALAASMSDSLAFPAKLLRASLHYDRGDEAGGDAALTAALSFGCRQNARFVHVDPRTRQRLYKRALDLDLEPDFVRGLIRWSGLASPDPYDAAWPWPIRIRTLGGLEIEIDGAPLAFSGKAPRKLLSLVKAIAAYGGRAVPEAKIADALWPDEEADAAFNALNVAIHRLRKLLGDTDAIVVSNGTIGFDPGRCWLDLWAFEGKLDRRRPEETREAFERRIGEGLALYRGEFLPDDDDAWWTAERRAVLRKRSQGARAIA